MTWSRAGQHCMRCTGRRLNLPQTDYCRVLLRFLSLAGQTSETLAISSAAHLSSGLSSSVLPTRMLIAVILGRLLLVFIICALHLVILHAMIHVSYNMVTLDQVAFWRFNSGSCCVVILQSCAGPSPWRS